MLIIITLSTEDLEHAPVLSANHTGPMIEGTTYLLQCAVYNVAPVRTLTVMWYRGDVLIGHSPADNSTERPSPVNVTASLRITPTKHDDGAQFRCDAELNLGQEGPQPPPPKMISQSVSITVHCESAFSIHQNCQKLSLYFFPLLFFK